jgi:glycerol-3-phosphate dehydrogenase
VLALIQSEPALGRPLAGASGYLQAEVVCAVSHEGARHLDDVLTRRTHISMKTWDRGLRAARQAAELMAGPLGWGRRQVCREAGYYQARIAAGRAW